MTARDLEAGAPLVAACVVGVLAGGEGRRMGGRDKALLITESGETVLGRIARIARDADLSSLVVAGGVQRPGLCVVPDQPAGIGPLGGMRALLAYAAPRPLVVLGCDMPYVTAELLVRLSRAPSRAAVLAARDVATGKWQPLFARYDSARALASLDAALAAGVRSFQTWFESLGVQEVEEFALAAAEHAQLRDWDEPSDMAPR